jgi:anti-anti-sigma factor
MEIRQETVNGATVLQLLGRLDELATSEVELAFTGLLKDSPREVVLDLAGVEYISSGGLRILLMLSKALGRNSGRLKLCNLSPFVAEVFEISNFASIFSIYGTLQDALNPQPEASS